MKARESGTSHPCTWCKRLTFFQIRGREVKSRAAWVDCCVPCGERPSLLTVKETT